MTNFLSAVFLTTILISNGYADPGKASSQSEYFNLEQEFPNYFLPDAYRGQSEIPHEVVQQSKRQLEAAMNSILTRMTVPISTGGKSVQMVRYFDYIPAQIAKLDSTARIMPSGGVVRSVIGYIYSEMYNGMNQLHPVSPEVTLRRLTNTTDPIPAYKVRGVGSDFDILVQSDPAHFEQVKKQVEQITNSAETNFGARNIKGDFKKSLFTIGDVKDYVTQTTRSTRQGGAAIDFLAFDLQKGKFVEPSNVPGIVDKLVQGKYSYLAPESSQYIEDAAKQTVRGIRPLLELPFLKLENEEQFRKELNALLERKGVSLSTKAMEQFNKTIRNARFSGAKNRIIRAPPDSIEELVKKVNEQLGHGKLIPEFGDRFRLDVRTGNKAELKGLPKELLTPVKEFISNSTTKGILFHGTPNVDNGMAIMRGGLFISSDKQGVAAYGRGVYSSPLYDTAQGYAGSNGVVFELQVKPDERLNILDWQKAESNPKIQEIINEAKKKGKDPFEVLAREHGIDIIVNHHVLIQNLDAVQIPDDVRTLINALSTVVDNNHSSAYSRIKAFTEYSKLYEYSQALGETGVKPPMKASSFVRQLVSPSGSSEDVLQAISSSADSTNMFRQAASEDPHLLSDLLNSDKKHVTTLVNSLFEQDEGKAALFESIRNDPKIMTSIERAFNKTVYDKTASVVERIGSYSNLREIHTYVNNRLPSIGTAPEKASSLINNIIGEIGSADVARAMSNGRSRAIVIEGMAQDLGIFEKLLTGKPEVVVRNLLDLTNRTEDAIKVMNLFSSNPKLKTTVRDIVISAVKKDPEALKAFPWDLNDPKDKKFIEDFIKSHPSNYNSLYDRFRNFGFRMTEIYPRFRPMEKNEYGSSPREANWQHYDPKRIKNPKLREELTALQRESKYATPISTTLDRISTRQPIEAVKTFPDYGITQWTRISSIENSRIVLSIDDSTREISPAIERVRSLLKNIFVDGKAKFSEDDMALLNNIIRAGDSALANSLLSKASSVSNYVLTYLKSHEASRTLELLNTNHSHISELEKDGRDKLSQVLAKDTEWQASILKSTIKDANFRDLKGFPWDIKNKDQVEALRTMALNLKEKRERLLSLAKSAKSDAISFKITWNDFSETPGFKSIHDEKLRASTEQAWKDYQMSAQANETIENLVGLHPNEAAALFSELQSGQPKLPSSFNRGSIMKDDDAEKLIQKMNTLGIEHLSAEDVKALSRLAALPLDESSKYFFSSLVKGGPISRTWAIERLTQPQKNDSLAAIMQIIGNESKQLNGELKKSSNYDRFKSKFRGEVLKDPKLLSIYPLDLKNAKDVALLKKIADRYPVGASEYSREFHRIALELSKKDRDFSKLAKRSRVAEIHLPDLGDKPQYAEFIRARQSYSVRYNLERDLSEVFLSDPKMYLTIFRNEHVELSPSNVFETDGAKIKNANFAELFDKIKKDGPGHLDETDSEVLHTLLSKESTYRSETIALLLQGKQEAKDLVIQFIKSGSSEANEAVFRILKNSGNDWSESGKQMKIFNEYVRMELKVDKAFRASVRSAAISGNDVSEFPWDLSDAGDASALKSTLKSKDAVNRNLKTLHKIASQKGLNMDWTHPWDIPDPKLRDLYVKAYYQQGAARAVERVLEHEGISTEKFLTEPALGGEHRDKILSSVMKKLNEGGACEP